MLDGTLAAKEDTALKAYFKQQGLIQQEAEKAKNQPDLAAMQTQFAQAKTLARQAQLQSEATTAAVSLGIEAKTIPYVLKMADFSQAIGQDGKVNGESLKAALSKVLEDVPALKPQAAGSIGFVHVGASGQGTPQGATDTQLDSIFGVKKG